LALGSIGDNVGVATVNGTLLCHVIVVRPSHDSLPFVVGPLIFRTRSIGGKGVDEALIDIGRSYNVSHSTISRF